MAASNEKHLSASEDRSVKKLLTEVEFINNVLGRFSQVSGSSLLSERAKSMHQVESYKRFIANFPKLTSDELGYISPG